MTTTPDIPSEVLEDSQPNFGFLVGTLPDKRVIIDFRGAAIPYLALTTDQALQLAEGLVEAAKLAMRGRHIITSERLNPRGRRRR